MCLPSPPNEKQVPPTTTLVDYHSYGITERVLSGDECDTTIVENGV